MVSQKFWLNGTSSLTPFNGMHNYWQNSHVLRIMFGRNPAFSKWFSHNIPNSYIASAQWMLLVISKIEEYEVEMSYISA